MGIFIFIGMVGFVIFFISAMVGDHDVGHDIGHEISHDAPDSDTGPSFFSFFAVSWFLMGFGACGAVASYYKIMIPFAVFLALLGGMMLWGIAFSFMKLLYSQQSNSTITTASLIGTVGTVTIPIDKGSIGKMECMASGTAHDIVVRSKNGEEIKQGESVRIASSSGNIYIVERV
ncbi:MAG TPA: NfeD family protein [archaeon]|nr:NfeD family protein [archaeon]